MTSYIVRIYRRGHSTGEIAGTVVAPGREVRTPFHSFGELKAILLRDDTNEASTAKRAEPEGSKHV